MIPGKPFAVAVALLAASAAAQENTDEQRIAELIAQLDHPDALERDTAMHRLVEIGRAAARTATV